MTPWNPYADGPVYALAVSGSTVYAGGAFLSVDPQHRYLPMSANHIVGLITSDGTPTGWFPTANDVVNALAVSGPTGYGGGNFTSIGGQTRSQIAALDAAGNATAWNPNANGTVRALSAGSSSVFVGGDFTSIGGQARNRIAMLDATINGNMVTNWEANADAPVRSLALDSAVLYAGGDFTSVKAASHVGFAGVIACRTSIFSPQVTEGNSGTVNAVFSVTLSPTAPFQVTVDYSTQDGTATVADGDYQAASGQVVFAPGQS